MADQTLAAHNWQIYGHDWAVDYLRKGMWYGRTRHAYLITGAVSVGKTTLAREFAMSLNCTGADIPDRPCRECRSCRLIMSGNHPDIIFSQTDENTGALKIEEIRAVMSKLALKPYEARYRIAVMDEFDRAQPRAQDALLKTLEEPPPTAVLILLSTSTERIMSTITSRCQQIRLRPVARDAIYDMLVTHFDLPGQQADLLARLSGGRPGWAVLAAQYPDTLDQRELALNLLDELLGQDRAGRFATAESLSKDRLALKPLLELWQSYWRDVLLLAANSTVDPCNVDRIVALEQRVYDVRVEDAVEALRATQALVKQLNRGINVNLRLALEVLFLSYPGLPQS